MTRTNVPLGCRRISVIYVEGNQIPPPVPAEGGGHTTGLLRVRRGGGQREGGRRIDSFGNRASGAVRASRPPPQSAKTAAEAGEGPGEAGFGWKNAKIKRPQVSIERPQILELRSLAALGRGSPADTSGRAAGSSEGSVFGAVCWWILRSASNHPPNFGCGKREGICEVCTKFRRHQPGKLADCTLSLVAWGSCAAGLGVENSRGDFIHIVLDDRSDHRVGIHH